MILGILAVLFAVACVMRVIAHFTVTDTYLRTGFIVPILISMAGIFFATVDGWLLSSVMIIWLLVALYRGFQILRGNV